MKNESRKCTINLTFNVRQSKTGMQESMIFVYALSSMPIGHKSFTFFLRFVLQKFLQFQIVLIRIFCADGCEELPVQRSLCFMLVVRAECFHLSWPHIFSFSYYVAKRRLSVAFAAFGFSTWAYLPRTRNMVVIFSIKPCTVKRSVAKFLFWCFKTGCL